MIRILHVVDSMDYSGGIQAMLMNYYRCIDRSRIQFDFAIHWNFYGEKALFENEINAMGGKVYLIGASYMRQPLQYIRWWRDFFRAHPYYDIVEGHYLTSGALYLTAAKRAGCHTIAHSHSSWEKGGPRLHAFLLRCSIWPIRFIADDFAACAVKSGKEYFGARVLGSDRFRVVNNAIDCERFAFSAQKREAVRSAYQLKDELLIGHVGRFAAPKNHVRLLKIFKAVLERCPSARLMLLGGSGPCEDETRRMCSEMGLEEAVIFAGLHENIEDYYAAMDVFCFPSLWEGLPVVVVETQTNGLPSIVSEAVPKTADIGAGLFVPMSLQQSDEQWAEALLAQHRDKPSSECVEFARRAGYDSSTEAKKLEEYYQSMVPQA